MSLFYRLKVLIGVVFLLNTFTNYSQVQVGTSGDIEMVGDAGITSNGCWYYAFLRNNGDAPVYISASKFKAKFTYLNSDGKIRGTTKRITFPNAFLAPNSVMEKDRRRTDSDSKTYTNVRWVDSEMGDSREGFSSKPDENAILISLDGETYIGSKFDVDFYLSVRKTSSAWTGFNKYGLELIVKNKDSYKKKIDANINYVIYIHGKSLGNNIKIARIKANSQKVKKDIEPIHCNFTPTIYVSLGATGLNTGEETNESQVSTTTANRSSSTVSKFSEINLNSGCKLLRNNEVESKNYALINSAGDTLSKNITYAITNDGWYAAKGEEFSNFKNEDYHYFVSRENNESTFFVLNASTNNYERHNYYNFLIINNKVHELYQKSKGQPYKIKEFGTGTDINEFNYKSVSIFDKQKNYSSITDVRFLAKNSANKYGVINAFNKTLCNFKYDYIYESKFGNGYYKVYVSKGTNWKVNKTQGVINSDFVEIIPPIYDYIEGKGANTFVVYKKVSVNSKNLKTTMLDDPKYGEFQLESFQVAVINNEGKILVPFGKLKYVITDISMDEFKLIVNKKKPINLNGSIVYIIDGMVVSIAFPSCNEIEFEGNFPCKEFTDVQELRLFSE